MTDISAILVGRDSREYVKLCIESLARAEWDDYSYEVVYVDNGSKDGSVKMIAEEFPEVRCISNETNLGFCRAANQGAEIASGRHLCLLNDDTIVIDDAVARLARYLDDHPEAGAIGSRLVYPDMTEQWSARRFPSPVNGILGRRSLLTRLFPDARPVVRYLYKDRLQQEEPFEVDWVSAAAMMLRADVYEEVGGCAEDYYYWHEAILCDRVRKTGREVLLDPRSRIIHFEGKGSGARPFPVQAWHIRDFHYGAYRCYCEHHRLARLSPRRAFAAATLSTRALLLLGGAWLVDKLPKRAEGGGELEKRPEATT